MAVERMGLKEAGLLLGITRNAVKARVAAGKLRGERGNLDNKWWVFLDPETVANDKAATVTNSGTDASNDSGNDIEKSALFAALTGHIDTLKAERDTLRAEVARLQPRAELADRLQAQLDALQGRLGDRAGEIEHLRAQVARMDDERRGLLADYLAKIDAKAENLPAEQPRGFFRWLRRGKS